MAQDNTFDLAKMFQAANNFVQNAQPTQQSALQGANKIIRGASAQPTQQMWDQYDQATKEAALSGMRPGTSYGLTAPQISGLSAMLSAPKINAAGVGQIESPILPGMAAAAQGQQALYDREANAFSGLAGQGASKLGLQNNLINNPIAQAIASPQMMKAELASGFTGLDAIMNAPQKLAENIDRANPNMSPTERLQTLNKAMESLYSSFGSSPVASGIVQALHAPDSNVIRKANNAASSLGLSINPSTTMNAEMAKMANLYTGATQSQSVLNANYKNLSGFRNQVSGLPDGTVTSGAMPIIKSVFGDNISLGAGDKLQVLDANGKPRNFDPSSDNLSTLTAGLVSPVTGEPYVTPEQVNSMLVKAKDGSYSLNGKRLKDIMNTVTARAAQDNIKVLSAATPGGQRDIDEAFGMGLNSADRMKLQSSNWVSADQVVNKNSQGLTNKADEIAKKYQDSNGLISGKPAMEVIYNYLLQHGQKGESLQGGLDQLDKLLKGTSSGSRK